MSDAGRKPPTPEQKARADRLAQALRANLRCRKAAASSSAEKTTADDPPPFPGEGEAG